MKFIIYTIPGCPYCKQTKTLLNKNNLEFKENLIEDYNERQKLKIKHQHPTFPQIFKSSLNSNRYIKIGGLDNLMKILMNFKTKKQPTNTTQYIEHNYQYVDSDDDLDSSDDDLDSSDDDLDSLKKTTPKKTTAKKTTPKKTTAKKTTPKKTVVKKTTPKKTTAKKTTAKKTTAKKTTAKKTTAKKVTRKRINDNK